MALFARQRGRGVPRGHRPDRAVRADRAWRRGASATSSTASCGAARPTRRCPGRWCFRSRAAPSPRHPSQLYQFALEGAAAVRRCCGSTRGKPRALGQVSGAFLVGYGVLRFVAEFFREPDSFLGLLALGLSMGQWLCVPMVLAGGADLVARAAGGLRATRDATGLSRHRNHRPEPRGRRPRHRDRLRRDGQPPPDRAQPALLSEPRAAEQRRRVQGARPERRFLADKPLFAAIADELLAYLAGAES